MPEAASLLRHRPSHGWLLLAGSWQALAGRLGVIETLIAHEHVSDLDLIAVRGDEVEEHFSRLQFELEELTGIVARTTSFEAFWKPQAVSGVPYRTIILLESTSDNVTPLPEPAGLFSPRHNDAIVLAAGASADAVGEWKTSADGDPRPGLNLLSSALVMSETRDVARARQAADLLQTARVDYLLALPANAVIQLGPEGAVRVDGDPPPKITLSGAWKQR